MVSLPPDTPQRGGFISWLRRPLFLVVAGVIAVAWLLPFLLSDDSGWRLGLPFRIFYTVIALLGALFFVLVDAPTPRAPRTGWGVFTSVSLVYLLTVGFLVGIGFLFPNFDTPTEADLVVAETPAERGEAAFFNSATTCILCHAVAGQGGTRGPDMSGIASRGADRVPGLSAEEYIRQSILQPRSFQVDGFDPIMPENLVTVVGEDKFEDLVAFLLTLDTASE